MRDDIHIFVYGTLRRGTEGNILLRDSRFIGKARTKEKYAMYADGIPYVFKAGNVSRIAGEVYAVNESTLGLLDDFENHPDLYSRELVDVVLESGVRVKAWIYFSPKPCGALVASGDFLNPG